MSIKRCVVAVTTGLLALLSLPSIARAELHGAKLVAFITNETPEACAASIEVTQSKGGLTDGTETLELGSKYSYSFSAGAFTPKDFGVGASVLYGSEKFEKETGAKVDVRIPDSACADFNTTGGDLSFSGSLGRNPDLFRHVLPRDGGTLRGWDGTRSIDLRQETLDYRGFTGTWRIGRAAGMGTVPLGTGSDDGDGEESSSCSLSGGKGLRAPKGLFVLPVMAVLAGLAMRRRRAA